MKPEKADAENENHRLRSCSMVFGVRDFSDFILSFAGGSGSGEALSLSVGKSHARNPTQNPNPTPNPNRPKPRAKPNHTKTQFHPLSAGPTYL
jgi:hypothetical protein